jgi:hypothetical protein
MNTRWAVTAVAGTMLCAGCVTSPSGPSVLVLPGTGKPFEQFQVDVDVCRSWAAQQATGASSYVVQRRYDNAYVQCMYAKGHQVPGRRPATPAAPPASPAPPAGPPPAPSPLPPAPTK